MNSYNLVFWLLFQYTFVCDQALEFPQSSRIPDSQQKQTSDKAKIAFVLLPFLRMVNGLKALSCLREPVVCDKVFVISKRNIINLVLAATFSNV